jgi:iron(III) transport system substrate-binding protein
MPDIELQRARYRYPLAYVLPKSGVPLVMDGIALVAKPATRAAAREYYEFVTSKPSLIRAAHKFYRIPCRNDIPADELPRWIGQTPINVMPVDREILSQKSREWMRYWDEHIRHKGTASMLVDEPIASAPLRLGGGGPA